MLLERRLVLRETVAVPFQLFDIFPANQEGATKRRDKREWKQKNIKTRENDI